VEALSTLFTMLVVVFIVSMMLAAGLQTTIAALGQVFRKIWLVILVLIVNFVLIPLLGWGIAEMLALATPAYIAIVLLACSPGAPFGAKAAVIQRGDVVTASALQVLMAAVGSITFPFTANWIMTSADLGDNVSLPVARLVGTVVVLQLVPFIVGLAVRNWAPHTAGGWHKTSMKISNISFIAVIVGALLGSWRMIVDLIGSRALLGAIIFAVIAIALGSFLAVGTRKVRTTVGLLAPLRNAGPVMAAVGIGFANDPAILGAVTAMLMVMSTVAILFASFLARKRPAPEEASIPSAAGRGAQGSAELGIEETEI
jgi:BASS family bile acid:Na+ symporter